MLEARRWILTGCVQGVGYRPFIYLLAQQLGLKGVVQNQVGQVLVEAEGAAEQLDALGVALVEQAPPLARPQVARVEKIALRGWVNFEILPSANASETHIHIPPDLGVCDACKQEMQAPQNRRYLYPFINCTQCGPRYTLIARMPYDRMNTTMAEFEMCPSCRAEYENPRDRRFHAEPIACAQCGPQLEFVSPELRCGGEQALAACIEIFQRGGIVAVKGIGGYHLVCDATHEAAIATLRARKQRPHKPLAVMFADVEMAQQAVELDAQSQAMLCDAARPIVLLRRKAACALPPSIAPGLDEVGVMLPYSPLHHLLLEGMARPLVMTSANFSGEPVLTDSAAVEARLGKVADAFLHHNRRIARPADDAVVRIIAGQLRLIRPGRGIAPLEIELPHALPHPVLAVGGHMKNTIALGWGRRAVLSPHIGDLDAPRSVEIFEQVIADLQQLYGVQATTLVCDAHPHYASSRWAARQPLPLRKVWHHHAHAAALALEHGAEKNWLCFTWDGVGLGEDGTLWGGEALLGRIGAWQRVASLRLFRLPGGERAAREPWRSAAGLCWEAGIARNFPVDDVALLHAAWQRGMNAPVTTAVGRLFDGVAHVLGLLDTASYEGQGSMLLEQAAQGRAEAVAMSLREQAGVLRADWQPVLQAMLRDDVPVAIRAMQFHHSLAGCIVAQAQQLRRQHAFDAVGLTGGVFQNKVLAELAVDGLQRAGFAVYLPQRYPCNDGGLALGQLAEAGVIHG